MFLKSLEIFGFKSFADRTLIEFSDGISALLGPNGCGKSNVVDAIKWVVGEQSARSLRADTMEDVIFNGTETRKPLSVAEVTVTISNETGLLTSIDAPEIAIKRRLYRSGEAEYYINGNQVRLKELRELFWDTGIGKSAYSVMEQGKIDQILSSKPEDRRYLFEEAAGITKHKVRSREAELKLEKTEENMRQVGGVLAEVKRSHDTLKTQSEKTLRYRALREEIFAAELDLHLLRLRQFVQEKDRRDEEISGKAKERDKVRSEIDSINLSLEENFDVVNGMEAKLVDHQKTVFGLAVEVKGKQEQRKLLSSRVAESRVKMDQAALRAKSLRERLETLREDEAEKEGELASLRSRLREIEKNIADFEAGIHAAEAGIRDNEAQAAKAEAEIAALEDERADARRRLDAITEDIVAQLDARLKESGYSSAERRVAEESIESLIAAIQARISGKGAILEDLGRVDYDAKAADSATIVAKAAADLGETAAKVEELRVRYQEYKKTTPSFIDEFLSPEGIITKKRAIDREIGACDEGVAQRRVHVAGLTRDSKSLGEKVEEYRRTLEDQRGNRIRMQTQAAGAEEALALLRREIAGQEGYLKELENEAFLEGKRLGDSEEELGGIDEDIADIEKRGRELSAELERLEKDIALKNSDLAKRQDELKKRMERLGPAPGGAREAPLGARSDGDRDPQREGEFHRAVLARSHGVRDADVRAADAGRRAPRRPRGPQAEAQGPRVGQPDGSRGVCRGQGAIRLPLGAAGRPREGPRRPQAHNGRDSRRERRPLPGHLQQDQEELPQHVPTPLRRRARRAQARRSDAHPRVGHRDLRPAAWQEARGDIAALGRREDPDGDSPALRDLHGQA